MHSNSIKMVMLNWFTWIRLATTLTLHRRVGKVTETAARNMIFVAETKFTKSIYIYICIYLNINLILNISTWGDTYNISKLTLRVHSTVMCVCVCVGFGHSHRLYIKMDVDGLCWLVML